MSLPVPPHPDIRNSESAHTERTLNHSRRSSSHHSRREKPWEHGRRPSVRSSRSRQRQHYDPEERQELAQTVSRQSTRSKRRDPRWWKVRLFKGMIDDVKRRAPFYWTDWRDAWDYRVIPATVYMYFAKYVQYETPPLHTRFFGHDDSTVEFLPEFLPVAHLRDVHSDSVIDAKQKLRLGQR